MSWSFGFTVDGTMGSFDSESKAHAKRYHEEQAAFGNEVASDVAEQIDAAKDAARLILGSKCVGSGKKTYNVTLSGHANPNHEPAPGHANDTVTISITQVT